MSICIIKKPLELPDCNLLCYGESQLICSVCLQFRVSKNKIIQLHAKKLGGLLVNNEIVNKVICELEKVTKSPSNLHIVVILLQLT